MMPLPLLTQMVMLLAVDVGSNAMPVISRPPALLGSLLTVWMSNGLPSVPSGFTGNWKMCPFSVLAYNLPSGPIVTPVNIWLTAVDSVTFSNAMFGSVVIGAEPVVNVIENGWNVAPSASFNPAVTTNV